MNRKIPAMIVDDEPLARDALRVMIGSDPEIEIVAECRTGREAVAVIRENAPDIVFLDVQMPDADGFEVVARIGAAQMPVTIFVTAYDRYALRAFAAHALDYLLKPFDHDRFNDALRRAKKLVRERRLGALSENLLALLTDISGSPPESSLKPAAKSANEANDRRPDAELIERLAIKSNGRVYFLKVAEIEWIEAMSDYARLHAANGKTHVLRETMNRLQTRLDAKKFLRIHRSIIVNVEFIRDIHPLFKGEHVVTLTGGKQLKSSRGYRAALQTLLDQAR